MMRAAVLSLGALLVFAGLMSAPAGAATKVSSHHPTCKKNLRAVAAASNPWCPFGVLGVLPPPKPGNAADVGSAPLPGSTRSLNLVADLQDPEGEGFFDEYAAIVIKPTAPVEGQVDGCLLMGTVFTANSIAFAYDGRSTLVACATLAKRLHSKQRACRAIMIPGFKTGATPSRAMIVEARKRMEASMHTVCARPHKTQLSVTVKAPSGVDLNGALGTRAHAATGAFVRSGVSPSKRARLVYGWGVSSG